MDGDRVDGVLVELVYRRVVELFRVTGVMRLSWENVVGSVFAGLLMGDGGDRAGVMGEIHGSGLIEYRPDGEVVWVELGESGRGRMPLAPDLPAPMATGGEDVVSCTEDFVPQRSAGLPLLSPRSPCSPSSPPHPPITPLPPLPPSLSPATRCLGDKKSSSEPPKEVSGIDGGVGGGGGGRLSVGSAGWVECPVVLDVPEFRAEWDVWVSYRREKRASLGRVCAQRQLAKLARMGLAGALASIDQSVTQGWTGLFPAREGAGGGVAVAGSVESAWAVRERMRAVEEEMGKLRMQFSFEYPAVREANPVEYARFVELGKRRVELRKKLGGV